MTDWPRLALNRVRLGQPLALVTVLATEGSAPREAGARMLVWSAGQWGTIGGGNLEHQATAQARRMLCLDDAPAFAVQDYPLGPLLAQCCGGRVLLLIERLEATDQAWLAEAARVAKAGGDFAIRLRLGENDRSLSRLDSPGPSAPTVNGRSIQARGAKPTAGDRIVLPLAAATPRLRLFGAGHVGQAIARALTPLPFRLDWYDSRPEVAAETGARLAPPEALRWVAAEPAPFTLVLTHDHGLDYALVLATLTADSGGAGGYLGLIGSRTKRARFARRLREDGISEAALARLICPIGLPGLAGKAPPIIAAAVAADLLIRAAVMAPATLSEPAIAGL